MDTETVAAVAAGVFSPIAVRATTNAEPNASALAPRGRLPDENMRDRCGERIDFPSDTCCGTSENSTHDKQTQLRVSFLRISVQQRRRHVKTPK
ncbi:hypothetical protein GCM10027200_88040 [Lentzea nigeriaca]